MEYEIKANQYGAKSIARSMLILVSMWFLNEINVFIIDKYLMRYASAIVLSIWMATLIIIRINGVEKKWIKYLELTTEVLGVAIVYVFISYHVTLVIPLPFLMAANYQDRRVSIYTYVISVICICISVVLNYQYGLCDMNMVAFTKGVVWDYGETIVQKVEPLTSDIVGKILLFFAFPRCLILTLYAAIASNIAKSGKELHIHREKAEKASKTDEMTDLANKNEYLRVIKEEFAIKKHVGVIFIDINDLKKVNDEIGHEKGDEMIKRIAKSIKYIEDEDLKGYRIGGDEFVILMENASNARLLLVTEQWKRILDMLNETNPEIKCSAAYGYSYGDGANIDEVISEADKNMYECKKEMKGL